MAVKIRLARRGRKRKPIYSIVIADVRAPRDGRFIEKIGQYNPNTNPVGITLDSERALYRLMTGAQPTETVRSILSKCGVMLLKHLQVGVRKDAITQEQANERYEAWAKERGGIANEILLQKKAKEELAIQKEVEKIRKETQNIESDKELVKEIKSTDQIIEEPASQSTESDTEKNEKNDEQED